MRFRAHQYQIDAAKWLLANPYAALFADPGTGKTSIMLMVLSVLKQRGVLDGPVLVTAPLRIASIVWPDEIAKWDQFNGLTYRLLHGRRKADRAAEDADVHLINNEGLKWAHDSGVLGRYRTLIIDEISKYKNWSSGRTKILKAHIGHFDRRYGLTGTPTPKSMMDIFGQMYLVDGGQSLGRYITHFRNRYFVDKGWGVYPDWQLRDGAEQMIQERISPWCFRLDGDKLLDMPPLICNDIRVDVPKKYKKKSIDALSEIDFSAPINGAGAYMLSRRFAGGVFRGEILHTAKLDVVKDIIDELNGKPAMIGYYYTEEGEMLRDTFKAPLINKDTSIDETREIVHRWNRKELPVVVCQPAAMGHGLNMQTGGNTIIWYSLTDNQDDYYQMIRRVWRQGFRGRRVNVLRLIASGTADVAIARGLDGKTWNQQAFLDAIRELTR